MALEKWVQDKFSVIENKILVSGLYNVLKGSSREMVVQWRMILSLSWTTSSGFAYTSTCQKYK